jgi:hypothetical protein
MTSEWRVGETLGTVLGNEGKHYTVENDFAILAIVGPVNPETEAIARLMAAAPELRKVLAALTSTVHEDACTCDERRWRGPGHDGACPVSYVQQAEVALAKARGEVT